jgi:hypothetical protein
MIFLTLVNDIVQKKSARLLIKSIRSFGGELADSPIWLFESHPLKVPCHDMAHDGVQVFPLIIPKSVSGYDFAEKVFTCALAEKMVKDKSQTLTWIDPCCLVVQPPLLFDLSRQIAAAVRPVHIQNVGLHADEQLDDYWRRIYQTLDLQDISLTVESFVDQQHLRAYFNTHAFAINPSKGMLQRWFTCFEKLVCDEEFQDGACRDEMHKLFLFQAVFSTLLVATSEADHIRILPPTYNYPYHLHPSVPPESQASTLNDLVLVAYEDESLDPLTMLDIAIHEPLKTWLIEQTNNRPNLLKRLLPV